MTHEICICHKPTWQNFAQFVPKSSRNSLFEKCLFAIGVEILYISYDSLHSRARTYFSSGHNYLPICKKSIAGCWFHPQTHISVEIKYIPVTRRKSCSWQRHVCFVWIWYVIGQTAFVAVRSSSLGKQPVMMQSRNGQSKTVTQSRSLPIDWAAHTRQCKPQLAVQHLLKTNISHQHFSWNSVIFLQVFDRKRPDDVYGKLEYKSTWQK